MTRNYVLKMEHEILRLDVMTIFNAKIDEALIG